ncbi:MAG: T9SS type A sorting domain-containing protein [Bacteroidales bacterium]|nr:T9SS type A sorting domain-containing protein [Bacteroidales bacterium]
MKQLLLLSLFSLFFNIGLFSQNWGWGKHVSGPENIFNQLTAIDPGGNVIVAAAKMGTVSFVGTAYTLEATQNSPFIAKYSSDGDIVWLVSIGDKDATNIKGLAVDNQGSVIITGQFQSANEGCVFGSVNPADNDTLPVSSNKQDVFCAKYDNNGNLLWVYNIGRGKAGDYGYGVVADAQNNIYVTGYFNSDSLFIYEQYGKDNESPVDTLVLSDGNTKGDGFVIKYSPDAEYLWHRNFTSTKYAQSRGGVAAAPNNGIYLAIDFTSNVTVADSDPLITANAVGNKSVAIFHISQDGVVNWVRVVRGSYEGTGVNITQGSKFSSDVDGNLYAIGQANTTLTFDDGAGGTYLSLPCNSYDGWIARYNSQGVLQWANIAGGISDDRFYDVSCRDGVLSTVGLFKGETFLPSHEDKRDTLTNNGGQDLFLVNYSVTGQYLSSATLGGSLDDEASSVTITSDGNSVVGGSFTSATLGIPGVGTFTNGGVKRDMILAKHINIHIVPKIMEISCADGADGALHIAIHGGGVQPYTYAFSKVGGSPIGSGTYSDTLKFENLSAGTYSIVVTDGASHSVTKFYAVSNPIPISIGGTVKNVEGCYGEQTGEITLTVTGGTGEYAYLWDSQDGYGYIPTVTNQSNITAGNYTVKVIDSNGCEATQTFTVTQPSKINFTGSEPIGNTSSDPATPNGLINLVVNNATAPTYSWQGPNGFTSTDASISGLRGGTYVLTVTAGTCSADTIFNITDQYLFNALVTTVINPRCKGGSDGSATVEVFNSTGGVTAQWSNGQTNVLTATNLQAGLYSITLTDDSGTPDVTGDDVAITLMPVVVSEPDFALEVATTPVKPTCPDSNDGEIAVSVNGWSFPYTFTWTESEGGSGVVAGQKDQEGLTVGYYTVVVTDVYGCEITKNVNLGAEYGSPSIVLTATPSANVSEGTPVTLTATGGLLYEFFVNDVSRGASSSKNSITIDSPVNGTKVVVNGYNTAGCLGVSNEIVITVGTGISTNPLDALSVYPNPFSNCLNISKPELVSRIEVLSIVGQKVLDVTPNGTGVIEVEQLPAGVYLLRISGKNGETSVRKIIKE